MNIIKRIRRIWRKLRNSDPIYNCPVYKNEGCAFVDGPFCIPSNCKIVYNYLDRKWVGCVMCKFNDECCSKYYGFGCCDGIMKTDCKP